MLSATYISHSEADTIELGRYLARHTLPEKGFVLLTGNLGAGKTTLVKGIAAERTGVVEEEVSSPTFALIHEYGDPARVYHIDLYRLESPEELATLGLEDLEDRDALVLVEWGERFAKLLPPAAAEITIDTDQHNKTISVTLMDGPDNLLPGR